MTPRWRVVEKQFCFQIFCEREKTHIEIHWGDTNYNIPLFGTKDEARLDARTMCAALNARDSDPRSDPILERLPDGTLTPAR
jgi:hypothetical protein